MSFIIASKFLFVVVRLGNIMSIYVDDRPIVFTLQNLVRCPDTTMMPTNGRWMTRLKNTQYLNLGHTSTSNPIRETMRQVWLIPKELFHIMHKLLPLVKRQIRGLQIAWKIISKVVKPRNEIMRISQYLFIWEHINNLTLITKYDQSFILPPRQVIGYLVLCPLAVYDYKINILQQQHLTNQSKLCIILLHQMPQCLMISMHYDLSTKKVRTKFLEFKYRGKKLLPGHRVILFGLVQCFSCIVYRMSIFSLLCPNIIPGATAMASNMTSNAPPHLLQWWEQIQTSSSTLQMLLEQYHQN